MRLCPLFLLPLLAITSLPAAETLKVTQAASLSVPRGSIGLRPGHELLLLGRRGDTLEVMFRNVSGTIPVTATNFAEGVAYESFAGTIKVDPGQDTPSALSSAQVAAKTQPPPTPPEKPEKPRNEPGKAAGGPKKAEGGAKTPDKSRVIEQPTTNYGKMVKKAEKVTKDHQKAHVDGTDKAVAP